MPAPGSAAGQGETAPAARLLGAAERLLLAALESLAAAALAQGQSERAAHLFGAAEALREAGKLPGPDGWRRARERMGEAVRAATLEQAFAAAWAEGRALSLERAVRYAVEQGGDA